MFVVVISYYQRNFFLILQFPVIGYFELLYLSKKKAV